MLAQIELQAVKNKIIRKENALRLYTIPIAGGIVQLRFIHHSFLAHKQITNKFLSWCFFCIFVGER